MQRFSLVLLLSLQGSFAFADIVPLHQQDAVCDHLLTARDIHLSDLIVTHLVEPDGRYLFSPREGVQEHEFRTAELLSSRLKLPLVILPKLSPKFEVPAVDGILFDDEGHPLNNVSLKAFFPAMVEGRDLNRKLRKFLSQARKSVARNYSQARWSELMAPCLGHEASDEDRHNECALHAKIFGLNKSRVRPVTIVIDYTQDPLARFNVDFRIDPITNGVEVSLKLEPGEGVSLTDLIRRVQVHPVIKEYIFLGPHHMIRVDASGYQMDEFNQIR